MKLAAEAKRIYDGFRLESLNGVVCSIPDEGLDAKTHRFWCARCRQRYRDLKALAESLAALAAVPDAPRPAAGKEPVIVTTLGGLPQWSDDLGVPVSREADPSAPTPYESGLCCLARHANATPPWTCDCPCHLRLMQESES